MKRPERTNPLKPSSQGENPSFKRRANRILQFKQKADARYGNLSNVIQFLIVGGLGTAVNLAVITIAQRFSIDSASSVNLGILVSLVHNFFWHRELTFRDSKHRSVLKQFGMFVLFSLAGLTVNFAVAHLLIQRFATFNEWPQLAAACGIVAGLVLNFVSSRYIVFRR